MKLVIKLRIEPSFGNFHVKKIKPFNRIFAGKLKQSLTNFEIFKYGFENEIEFFLNWEYWSIGEPERERYKLFELKKNKPISFLIDGKRDFSYSGRSQRIFLEHNYIFEYKGLFDVEISDKPIFVMKSLPKSPKEINLMKYVK